MQGWIYSSPFPALNPKVRYKTALERAGFDVNFHDKNKSREAHGSLPLTGRHVSEGGRDAFGTRSTPNLAQANQRAVSERDPRGYQNASTLRSPPHSPFVKERSAPALQEHYKLRGLDESRGAPSPRVAQLQEGRNFASAAPHRGSPQPAALTQPRDDRQRSDAYDTGSQRQEPRTSPDRVSTKSAGTRGSSISQGSQLVGEASSYQGSGAPQNRFSSEETARKGPVVSQNLAAAAGIPSRESSASQAQISVGELGNRQSSVFDFENQRNSPAERNFSSPDIDPVERSFKQLTQNANGSFSSQQEREFTPYARDSFTSVNQSDEVFEDAADIDDFNGKGDNASKWNSIMRLSKATEEPTQESAVLDHSPVNKYVDATPHTRPTSTSSISFTPVAELHVNLSPCKPTDPPKTTSPGADMPNLQVQPTGHGRESLTSSLGAHEEDLYSERIVSQNLPKISLRHTDPSSGGDAGRKQEPEQEDEGEAEEGSFQDPTATVKSSLQVERLLAQLDDVSLNRNLSVGNRRLSPGSSRFKKSSAYLSGFVPDPAATSIGTRLQTGMPGDEDQQNTSQVLSVAEDRTRALSGEISPGSDDSPQFYHIRKEEGPRSEDNRETDIDSFMRPSQQLTDSLKVPVIQPLQLYQLQSTAEARSEAAKPETTEEPRRLSNTSSHVEELQAAEPTAPVFKYPPGEGPCRACGLEVTSRRIYSKKANELSGQWHRPCFKCIKCELTFSKKVVCYILDDEPYCQRHFHETNNSICGICQGFIEGKCLENDRDERFHVDCLKCFRCGEFICEDYFLFNNELPLCSNHDIEALKLESFGSMGQNNTVSKRRTRIINFT
ncbi:LAQU0S19e00870g1_1 [Lachancea quebecensis]|uniref:LAQU0S19e00870g1_1 n=1 Tax=Lachancea quebecensis TaxID=1654605 RepID=A0A0P1KXG2_9SACH|nr:LAQU0S19e00870g1_1 [Lachancea quebecensis]